MEDKRYCPTCEKDMKVVTRAFNTVICTGCNKILTSDHHMDKVNGGK